MRKKNLKNLFIIFIFTDVILISNIPLYYKKFLNSEINNPQIIIPKNIHKSGEWFYYGNLLIDDENWENDWRDRALTFPWCFGSGTWNDPYIIENITIDGQGSGACITIQNSKAYFIIRNCEFLNGQQGIYLDDVTNGNLRGINCTSNSGAGIKMNFYYIPGIGNITCYENNLVFNGIGLDSNNIPFITVAKNNVSNNLNTGIYLESCDYAIVSDNTVENNHVNGIYSECHDSSIYNNVVINNSGYGIRHRYGNNCNITCNYVFNNSLNGISTYSANYLNIRSNVVVNNCQNGMTVYYSDYSNISDNLIIDHVESGIELHSEFCIINNNTLSKNNYGLDLISVFDYNLIQSNLIYNNFEGIHMDSCYDAVIKNNEIINNTGSSGIFLTESSFNDILFNNISNNYNHGIHIFTSVLGGPPIYSHDLNIMGNNISFNDGFGIFVDRKSFNSTIKSNKISHNGNDGINFANAGEPNSKYTISDNEINNNFGDGIYLYSCDNFTIHNNNIEMNFNHGLTMTYGCDQNLISNNYIYRCDKGINFAAYSYICMYNVITKNTLEDNNYGVWADAVSSNLFYDNYFLDNLQSAFIDEVDNYWNNTDIGNFWSDYDGIDINDDGIGDFPYNISTSPLIQDHLPIFSDQDDPAPPIISIVSPLNYQVTGIDSPIFKIKIMGVHVDTTWYEIINGNMNVTFTGDEVLINQELWDDFENGTVTFRFYVNDTLGYWTYDEVTVRKDINNPSLSINSPIDDTLFDSTSPPFIVEISDPNLDSSWYSLDGGLTKTFFTTNSSINQTIWDSMSDGQVEIIFYVNDTAGNLVYDSVIVNKDTTPPLIIINAPTSSELFGNSTINFNVEIYDLNLEKMWYTIVGSSMIITFTSNGTIENSLWSSFGTGDLTLIFYANDTHNRLSSESVIISKDIDPPSISIIGPASGEKFYVTPPEFEITVTDSHLDDVWYTIDGGITIIKITNYNDFIDENLWSNAPIGDIILRFYANDTLGNIAYSEVIITKESVSQTEPPPIPGYDICIIIGVISVCCLIIILKSKKEYF